MAFGAADSASILVRRSRERCLARLGCNHEFAHKSWWDGKEKDVYKQVLAIRVGIPMHHDRC